MADLSLSRKVAILAYLRQGPVSLKELARRFGTRQTEMREELSELFTTEISALGGFDTPVDIELPESGADLVVLHSDSTAVRPTFTLAEVISLLAVVDELIGVVDLETASELLTLRERLTSASEKAGYGSVLWPAPSAGALEVAHALSQAIGRRREVRIEYMKAANLRTRLEQATVWPVMLTTDARPLLVAGKAGALRTYRLDRIYSVEQTGARFSADEARHIRDAFAGTDDFSGTRVRLTCDVRARWVAESVPIVASEERDGELVIDLDVASIAWLRSLLIRLGDSVKRVEPAEIASRIAQDARAYLESGQI